MQKWITYEDFGAVGDGKHNDMPAIVQAHAHANENGLPVRAKPGAVYYIAPNQENPAFNTAKVCTSVDWTGAKFIIDDRNCQNFRSPVFHVLSVLPNAQLPVSSLHRGQTRLDNPAAEDLYVIVKNRNHADYIRYGLNHNNGSPRTDAFVLRADGTISSPVSFDFTEVTDVFALPIPQDRLTLTGGEILTIANQAESKYNYHARNINISRSNVEISGITHLVEGELDHGAPYAGFISISSCARVSVHDCVFTGHKIYQTYNAEGKPVSMGSYDINCNMSSEVSFIRCSQTTDIMDKGYWGLIGTNFCRDLLFEDCAFSRFDAHQGVSNCTLRRCTLGWQCLNAIGHGSFLIEDTDAYGYAFVNLRSDYGSTWRGEITIRNCTWHPLGNRRSVFSGSNDGHHWFGYDCCLPNVDIDGLTVLEDCTDDAPLCIFNNYAGSVSEEERHYMPRVPDVVRVKNIRTARTVVLCEKEDLLTDTKFICE